MYYTYIIYGVMVGLIVFTGYFIIDGQLLCEVHAKQNSAPPGENMRSAGAVYR